MKNIEEIKLMEIEALSDFEDHIGILLSDMDIFREYLDKKDLKKFNKCYDYLDNLWEKVEDIIAKISDADERGNNMEDKFTYVGRMYDWYEVKEDYLRVLFQVFDKETKSFYFYELQVYEPELISRFINLKPKQIIGVEGHFEELISHPDRGLSHIELEHVVDKIITSE